MRWPWLRSQKTWGQSPCFPRSVLDVFPIAVAGNTVTVPRFFLSPVSCILSPSSKLLGHAQDFVGSSDSAAHLVPAVLAQVVHAVAAGERGNETGVFIAHDAGAQLLVQLHQFEDADPA